MLRSIAGCVHFQLELVTRTGRIAATCGGTLNGGVAMVCVIAVATVIKEEQDDIRIVPNYAPASCAMRRLKDSIAAVISSLLIIMMLFISVRFSARRVACVRGQYSAAAARRMFQ